MKEYNGKRYHGSHSEQSFLYATVILGAATVLVKVLGAIFRIPLANLIGEDGMGYFSTAYDIYLPIYSLAMAGLPVAVSRMVAEQVAEGRYKDARQTFKIVKRAFTVTGIVGFILMFLVAVFVCTVANDNAKALPAAFVIAPSILFCCVMSTYRGYYEGVRNMYPTAISSLIEALSKLFLGLAFAWLILKYTHSLSYAAAGAMLGITLGTVFGAIYLSLKYKHKREGFTEEEFQKSPHSQSNKVLFKALLAIAIPVAIGSLVNNIASLIDVAMVQRQLSNAVKTSPDAFMSMYGNFINEERAISDIPNFLYGCYKGYAYTIFNLVPTITSVVGVSALPVLTMAWASKKKPEIKTNIESMLRIIALIAFPAGIGIVALSPQIIALLYHAEGAAISSVLLRILGISACLAGMTTPLTNMLQAIGKPSAPVKNIAVGAVIKIVVNFILVGIPGINIYGAPIGTTCCYLYIAIADIICLVKYSAVKPDLFSALGKPFISAAICGISAFVVVNVFSLVGMTGKMITLIAIVIAIFAYLIAVSKLNCIKKEDIESLPKGEKLVTLCYKLHIIR